MTYDQGADDEGFSSVMDAVFHGENYKDIGHLMSCMCTNKGEVKCSTWCAKRHNSLRCEHCPMVFLSKDDLVRHTNSSHSLQSSLSESAKKKVLSHITSEKHSTASDESCSNINSGTKAAVAATTMATLTLRMSTRKVDDVDVAARKDVQQRQRRTKFQCIECSKVCLSARGLSRHVSTHKRSPAVLLGRVPCAETFVDEEQEQRSMRFSEYHRTDEIGGGKGAAADEAHTAIPLKADLSERCDWAAASSGECGEDVERKFEPDSPVFRIESSSIAKREEQTVADATNEINSKKVDESVGGGDGGGPQKQVARVKGGGILVRMDTMVCSMCDEIFDDETKFAQHQSLTHGGAFPAMCDLCELQFQTPTLLLAHKITNHRGRRARLSNEEDPFSKWYVFSDDQKHLKCDLCKYNSLWYHKGRFLEHYRIHTGEKPFTCDQCGKQFRTKTLLQKHVMFVHEGIKEHACDICGRRFSDKRYMVDHRRIHTGERPYVCDLCGKTFKQSASLFIHKELHKGLRKHACDMCGKRFTTRSSLTIHIKRHVGERNFVCAICGKAFVDGKHLKDHMAVHSDERPFACELCGGRFKLMKHLKQHGRTHKRDFVT